MYQPSTDTLWEFWLMRRAADGWHARWGGKLAGGVVITGGAAAMPGVCELASDVFGTSVRIGRPGEQIGGLRQFTATITRTVDPKVGIEYRVAQWMDAHFRGSR